MFYCMCHVLWTTHLFIYPLPPNLYTEALIPKVMVFRGGALGLDEVMKRESPRWD